MPDSEGVTVERDDHGVFTFIGYSVVESTTAPVHRELEQRLDIFGRINTLPDYCQVLGRLCVSIPP